MALNATIYKFPVSLSDMNRDYYATVNLTVALHPSETVERMVVRVLAYCLNASEGLEFTKGLSTPDTPDIWQRNLDGSVGLWLEVGEPSADKIKKATRLADKVKVYSFNTKSELWWQQEGAKIRALGAEAARFDWSTICTLASSISRTTAMTVVITGNSLYITCNDSEHNLDWQPLND